MKRWRSPLMSGIMDETGQISQVPLKMLVIKLTCSRVARVLRFMRRILKGVRNVDYNKKCSKLSTFWLSPRRKSKLTNEVAFRWHVRAKRVHNSIVRVSNDSARLKGSFRVRVQVLDACAWTNPRQIALAHPLWQAVGRNSVSLGYRASKL